MAAPKLDIQPYQEESLDIQPYAEAQASPTLLERTGSTAKNFAGGVLGEASNILSNPIVKALSPGAQAVAPVVKAIQKTPVGDPRSLGYFGGQLATDLATPVPEVKALGLIPKVPRFVGAIGDSALQGGLFGALTSPQGSMGLNTALGAVGGGVLGAGANVGRIAANQLFRGAAKDAAQKVGEIRSPQEVAQLNQQLGNLPINFGEVINNPVLARAIYSAGKMTPFSGVKKEGAKLVGNAASYANNLLDSLRGNVNPEDVESTIQQNIINNRNSQRQLSDELYNKAFTLANENNVTLSSAPLVNAAKNLKSDLEDNLVSPSSDLDKAVNFILDKYNGTEEMPFQQVKRYRSQLLSLKRGFSDNLNRVDAARTNDLLQTLENGINEDIANKSPEVANAFRDANKFYRENVIPYDDDNTIQGIINDKKNITNIHTPLLQTNHATILEHMSPEQKNLVAYNLLSKASRSNNQNEKVITQNALSNAYNKLTPDIQERLFSPDQQEQFNKLTALTGASKEAAGQLYTPHTGAKLYEFAKASVPKVLAGALASGTGYAAYKLPLAAWPMAAATATPLIGGALYVGQKTLKGLYSPEIRQAYASGGFAPKTNIFNNSKKSKAGLAALMAASQFIGGNQ